MFVDWSSDGSHAILYGGDRFPDGNTWLFDTMDGSTTRITENATRTTLPSHLTITESGWSPDGQRVWIRADQLLLVERSGEVQAITDNFSGGLYYNSVEWNDPEQLLFGSRIDADENGVNIFDISTQQSTEIVADDLLMNFSMSPTNNFLAYFAYCDDREVFGLCILNMAEGEIQIYPSDPQESQGTGPLIWHIEQDILLYGESDIGSGTIYLIEPDANSRRTITTCSNFLEPCFGWLSGMRE
jgi:hypothetical protein